MTYQTFGEIWQQEIEELNKKLWNAEIGKRVRKLKTLIFTDPRANEFYIPTQIKAPSLLGKLHTRIDSGHSHNPLLSIVDNAKNSMDEWLLLKRYCEENFIHGTWRLSACSDSAFVSSQEFEYSI